MKSSRKKPYRFLALVAIFVALCTALPQLSRMSESRHSKSTAFKSKQDPQSAKGAPPQGKEDTGEGALNDAAVLTIPDWQRPKQRVNAPQAVAAATDQGEVEPNGTSATASPITGRSARIIANLFPAGDIDFYSFTANAGDRFYGAVMTSFSAGNSTDSQLTLLASDGTTTIEFDDDNGSFAGLSSSIAGATIPTTGTYFIKVNDFTAGTASERPYELWFQLQNGTPTPEVESNDTPATANPLPASGWVSGARNPAAATEQDWFSLSLNAGDTVFLSLDLDPERDGVTWNGRLGFALFGDAANQILVVDDAGTGDVSPNPNIPSEAFFMTVKDAGTYFAFVDSASAAVGGPTATYHLNVTVLPRVPIGVNCTSYVSTNVPQTIGPGTGLVSSTITVPGNPRIASVRVFLTLNHALMQDIDAHLRTPAGNDIGLFTDIGAAATGGQNQMDIGLDDRAGIPPAFTALKGTILKPELNYRLGWLKGENAGGTWTLDLRDDTAGANGGTLTAWRIEICEEPAAPSCGAGFQTQTVFSTDFESGAAGFTHSGTADEWELGTPATIATTTANPVAGFTTANSGVNAWKTDLDNTYNVSSSQDLLSPNINLTGLSGPVRLSWAMRYQMESANFDHASVDVREVGNPSNTKRVWEWLDATMTDPPGNPTVNIGASAGWGIYNADISSFAGKNIEVVFHLDSDTTVNFGGLAIDDVSVTACMLIPCMVTCPANITQSNTPNQCGAIVTYPAPTADAACGTVTCSPSSGSFFPVGTTTVTCTAAVGPSCNFTVTVNDTQAPTITCPANQTASSPGGSPIVVNYPAPTVTDNCSTSCAGRPTGLTCTPGTTTCTPASGSTFSVGTTTVNCTACDCAGNSAMCSFTVTVTSCTLTCPANITQSNTPNQCGAVVTYPAPTASAECGTVTCSPTSGSFFPVGTTKVNCTSTAGPTCSFNVTVNDTQPPTITCPANQTAISPSGTPIVVNYPAPTVTDNCSLGCASRPTAAACTPGTTTCTPASGSTFSVGTTTVNCTACDCAGNSANCSFTVTVVSCTLTCPANITRANDPNQCGAVVTFAPTASAGCNVTCTPPSGSFFPVGTTTVTCQNAGGSPSCSFTVTVNDTQPPTITCPANVTAVTPICAGTTAVVTYPAPTASDNCPGVTASCTPPSGSTFPVGTTTVTCTATDMKGNTATCSFTVTTFNACIQDDNNPNIVLLWNTQTGAYRFCCSGTTYTGTGVVTNKGNSHTINHMAPDRRVNGVLDCATTKGQGGLQSNAGTLICSINDRDIRNNTCSCGGAPPPTQ